jgi:hypothetical protein
MILLNHMIKGIIIGANHMGIFQHRVIHVYLRQMLTDN